MYASADSCGVSDTILSDPKITDPAASAPLDISPSTNIIVTDFQAKFRRFSSYFLLCRFAICDSKVFLSFSFPSLP